MVAFETLDYYRQVFPSNSVAEAQLVSHFYHGYSFTNMAPVISANKALGVKCCTKTAAARLTGIPNYSDVLNCSDLSGGCWTLLTDYRDFQPRSVLMYALPKPNQNYSFPIYLSYVLFSF